METNQLSECLRTHGEQNAALVSLPHNCVTARFTILSLRKVSELSRSSLSMICVHLKHNSVLDLLIFRLSNEIFGVAAVQVDEDLETFIVSININEPSNNA